MADIRNIFDRSSAIGVLSEMLALAKSGEILCVAVLALTKDGGITGVSHTESRLTMVGALYSLANRYSRWIFDEAHDV